MRHAQSLAVVLSYIWRTCLPDDLKTFSFPLTKRISVASSDIAWAQVIENGARSATSEWIKAEDEKAQLRPPSQEEEGDELDPLYDLSSLA